MYRIFDPTWVSEIKRRYKKLPDFQQPSLYRVAVFPEWEEMRYFAEDMVSQLNPEQQFEVIQRIRNPDQFYPTFNELVAGSIIKNCGHSLEYERALGEKTPDWYVYPTNGLSEFIVEVVTVTPPQHIQDEKRAWDELRYRIGKIDHYFHLWVKSRPTNAIVGKDIKAIGRFVQEWFGTFDLDSPPQSEQVAYKDDDLQIVFRLIPRKTQHKRSVEVVGPTFTLWVNTNVLRNKISKKLSKYREVKDKNLPLVIALFPSFATGYGIDSVLDVLFGKEQVKVSTGEIGRDRSGMVLPRTQKGKPILLNTRLSAVLFVTQSSPQEIRVFHNPFAENPIVSQVFKNYQQFMAVNKKETHFIMDWVSVK